MRRALSILPLAAVLVVASPTAAAPAPTPKQAVARAKQGWLSQLRRAAREGDTAKDFPSPPRAVLMRRLRRAQQLYRFQIVSVRMLHPLQAAPVVVIRSVFLAGGVGDPRRVKMVQDRGVVR